jgi:hypothetical protein
MRVSRVGKCNQLVLGLVSGLDLPAAAQKAGLPRSSAYRMASTPQFRQLLEQTSAVVLEEEARQLVRSRQVAGLHSSGGL